MTGSALQIERPGMRGVAPTRIAVVGAGGWGAQHARITADRAPSRRSEGVRSGPGRAPHRTLPADWPGVAPL